MKVLVTGFEPFGGEKINPAFEIINSLESYIEGAEVIKLQVPTVFRVSIEKICEAIDLYKPNFVIMLGQAGGRFDISVERIGINIDDARISDNLGKQPDNEPIDPNGLPAYFSTIPIKAIVEEIKSIGIPACISNSAGTFVCNHVLYGVLNYIEKNKLNIKAGFIHVPYMVDQVISKPNTPYMPLDMMIKAVEKAIAVTVANSSLQ